MTPVAHDIWLEAVSAVAFLIGYFASKWFAKVIEKPATYVDNTALVVFGHWVYFRRVGQPSRPQNEGHKA